MVREVLALPDMKKKKVKLLCLNSVRLAYEQIGKSKNGIRKNSRTYRNVVFEKVAFLNHWDKDSLF